VEAIGGLIKDRIGNAVWTTLEALEEAIGEELHPLCKTAERLKFSSYRLCWREGGSRCSWCLVLARTITQRLSTKSRQGQY
jgi:hypothetical protein